MVNPSRPTSCPESETVSRGRGGAVDAASEAARVAGAIATAAMSLLKKPGIALAGAAIGIGAGMPESSKAALIPDGASASAYINNANEMNGNLLWIESTYNGQNFYSSAVRINSGYALTAAHVAPTGVAGLTLDAVGTGSNYLLNPGTVDPIASYVTYPGYDFTLNGPDISLIKLANPLPGAALNLGGSSVGEELSMAGFGQDGTPSTGLSPQNGDREAWNVIVDTILPGGVSYDYYKDGAFDSSIGIPLNAKGANGDSGGPVFDGSGNLVGIIDAGTTGNSAIGETVYLNLAQPQVQQWIQTNSTVPEPATLSLLALGISLTLARRYRRLR